MQKWMVDFQSGERPDNKTIIDNLKDYGFYHNVRDVQRMYAEYVNNKKYWYGEAGVDQPDDYWKDIATCNWLSLYVDHVLPQALFQSEMSQEDVIDRLRRGGSLNG